MVEKAWKKTHPGLIEVQKGSGEALSLVLAANIYDNAMSVTTPTQGSGGHCRCHRALGPALTGHSTRSWLLRDNSPQFQTKGWCICLGASRSHTKAQSAGVARQASIGHLSFSSRLGSQAAKSHQHASTPHRKPWPRLLLTSMEPKIPNRPLDQKF